MGLDLHCPHISGPHNEVIYLVGSENRRIAKEQMRFSDVLASVARGPLPFSPDDFLAFGKSWNTGQNYTGGKGFARWITNLHEVSLGTAVEIPYANARNVEVNQNSARLFGADLGRAISGYFRDGGSV